MADVLRAFRAKARQVHIHFHTLAPDEIERAVLENRVNPGIGVFQQHRPGLALEPGCFRYAYRLGHAAGRCDVTRSLENPMETITYVTQTREGAACSSRTSRLDAAVCELLPIGIPGQFSVSTQDEQDDRTGGTKGHTYSRCHTVGTAAASSTLLLEPPIQSFASSGI